LSESPLSIDELVAVTGLTATRLSSMLCALELCGAVEAMPGGRYAVT
ncbi:MAG: DNA-protecting protein DprA, partial [Gammaproteobacteria bacterium]|nr:DNA-protecting protein DprA [Gammaproteobacteria bacterium]